MMNSKTKHDVKLNGTAPASDAEASAAAAAAPSEPVAEAISAEDLEKLKAKAAKADENWERFVRLSADFDNYKKRIIRERQEDVKRANEGLLHKLVTVLDNFDAATAAAANAPEASAQSLQAGVTMIHQQLKSVLAESGLDEINAAGQPFDPNFHEAVSHVESADVPDGNVLHQLRKGYKVKDRLLRPATVVVAKTPTA